MVKQIKGSEEMTKKILQKKEINHLSNLIERTMDFNEGYTGGYESGVKIGREQAMKEIEKEVMKHQDCKEYHSLYAKPATCLDMVLEKIKFLQGKYRAILSQTNELRGSEIKEVKKINGE